MENKTPLNSKPTPSGNYIKEFIMLFLAVFCGFMAENYREKLADDEAEQQSMQLLVKSLESDTVQLAKTITLYKERSIDVDSFIHLKDLDFNLIGNRRLFYKYAFSGLVNTRYFKCNQSGFEQLKYSGTIRQVQNAQLLERFGNYYNAYQTEILAQENDYRIWYEKAMPALMQVADFSIFGGSKPGFISVFFPDITLGQFPLPEVKMDAIQKRNLFGYAANIQIVEEGYVQLLEEQKNKADTLIRLLNTEYEFNGK